MVVFPHMIVPFFVGRPRSIRAVDEAMAKDKRLLLAAQKNTETEDPGEKDIVAVGTVGRVLQMLRLGDGTIRLLVEGLERARITRYVHTAEYLRAAIQTFTPEPDAGEETAPLMRAVQKEFERYCSLSHKVSSDVVGSVEKMDTADRLVDMICGNTPLRTAQKVDLLGMADGKERLEALAVALVGESRVLEIERDINEKVRRKLERSQKEYFLQEQMKEIQRELGGETDDAAGIREIEEKLKGKHLPEEAAARCQREIRRLSRMQPMSPESAVLRTYLEWICDLPWGETTQDSHDIAWAGKVLDEDHFDLKKVKERILDFIAVRQLRRGVKGPILCFIGPPGTGKTSLGRSVARALGRRFARISLGGVRDEAEIRGHRKTYVGALPGKILQAMKRAGSANPVLLLDEVDKMSSDYRGDPASALLEVLDPEQNSTFVDHYLELPYDLSGVMFITTANSAHNIPYALRDRMETIDIQGYSEHEKIQIAEQFLIRKQLEENGLDWAQISFERPALSALIRGYTLESGVRGLEREIANVLRKLARDAVARGASRPAVARGASRPAAAPAETALQPAETAFQPAETAFQPAEAAFQPAEAAFQPAEAAFQPAETALQPAETAFQPAEAAFQPAETAFQPAETALQPAETALQPAEAAFQPAEAAFQPAEAAFQVTIVPACLETYLGKPKRTELTYAQEGKVGLAYGLAWTELGGMLLPVEVAILEGRGKLILTGSMGEVMKESAQTALSFIRAHAVALGVRQDFARSRDIHIHIPEGAIPKDGPSAGLTIAAALLSAVRKAPLAPGFAMTGEITLTGRLLPIGGLKEKVLAAHRHGFPTVLIPAHNRRDTEELPSEVLSTVKITLVETVLEALRQLAP
jgi:ATP-dependent Lon protease